METSNIFTTYSDFSTKRYHLIEFRRRVVVFERRVIWWCKRDYNSLFMDDFHQIQSILISRVCYGCDVTIGCGSQLIMAPNLADILQVAYHVRQHAASLNSYCHVISWFVPNWFIELEGTSWIDSCCDDEFVCRHFLLISHPVKWRPGQCNLSHADLFSVEISTKCAHAWTAGGHFSGYLDSHWR